MRTSNRRASRREHSPQNVVQDRPRWFLRPGRTAPDDATLADASVECALANLIGVMFGGKGKGVMDAG
jgi:hypothetical protein